MSREAHTGEGLARGMCLCADCRDRFCGGGKGRACGAYLAEAYSAGRHMGRRIWRQSADREVFVATEVSRREDLLASNPSQANGHTEVVNIRMALQKRGYMISKKKNCRLHWGRKESRYRCRSGFRRLR